MGQPGGGDAADGEADDGDFFPEALREIDAVLGVADEILRRQGGVRVGQTVGQAVMGEAGNDDIGAGGEKFFPEFAELARGIGQSVEQDEDAIGLMPVSQDDAASALMQGEGGFSGLGLGPAGHGFVIICRRIRLRDEIVEGERAHQPGQREEENGEDGEKGTDESAA